MKTLEQIKNEYAKVEHYDNWDSLLNKQESLVNIEWHYNNIIKLAQMECLKLASDKAMLNWKFIPFEYYSPFVDKESITNENNIIK